MHWEVHGIVLTTHAYGDTSCIARLFTAEKGVMAGMVKGGFGKRLRPLLQPGNSLQGQWSARLEDQLGHFTLEAEQLFAASCMASPMTLLALQGMCRMLQDQLPERYAYPHLYTQTQACLQSMAQHASHVILWLANYCQWEMLLLQELGYALDVSECAATGITEHLTYLSPRSGRAVSQQAGLPYHAKLLPLPVTLRANDSENKHLTMQECAESLRVSGYFLEQWVYQPQGKHLPAIRAEWLQKLNL